jgi:hypothetical protein
VLFHFIFQLPAAIAESLFAASIAIRASTQFLLFEFDEVKTLIEPPFIEW